MLEIFLWLLVFAVFCWSIRDEGEREMSGQWYLVFRFRWIGLVMVRDRNPIDGVYASHSDVAAQIAGKRNDYDDDRLLAVYCSSVAQRMLASELNDRHTCAWWCRTDFVDWMCQPAYVGDQDKYLRTWTS